MKKIILTVLFVFIFAVICSAGDGLDNLQKNIDSINNKVPLQVDRETSLIRVDLDRKGKKLIYHYYISGVIPTLPEREMLDAASVKREQYAQKMCETSNILLKKGLTLFPTYYNTDGVYLFHFNISMSDCN